MKTSKPPSAWRQPMVWLVAAIPLASVAATAALIAVAGGAGATDDIADHVHRTAQVQVADLSADTRAQAMRLRAHVERNAHGLHVRLLAGTLDPGVPLQLALRHPTLAAQDRELALVRVGDGWTSDVPVDLGHDWNLQLGPRDGRWRLQGRWQARAGQAELRPAVDAR